LRKQLWGILLFFLIISAIPVISFIRHQWGADSLPYAKDGVLDLQEWNLESQGAVALRGEWEFYRNQLLGPEHFAASAEAAVERPALSGLFELPGEWNGYLSEDGKREGTGFGTYRLLVKLSGDEKVTYGIRTTNIRMANKLFLGDQEVGASGKPGPTKELSISSNIPYIGFAELKGNSVEIIIQVSNHVYANGGILHPVWFGLEQDILSLRDVGLFGDFISIVGFSLFFLFFMFLYFMRRGEKPLLYLALFCGSLLVFVVTHGEKLLGQLLPDMPYEMMLRLQIISTTFGYLFLLHYINVSVPGAMSGKLFRFTRMLAWASLVIGVLLPPLIYSKWFIVPALIFCTIISVLLVVLGRGVAKKTPDAYFLLLSAISLSIYAFVNLIQLQGMLDMQFYLSYELLVFVIVQILMLARRFSSSFSEVEQLSHKLVTLDGLKDEFMANTSHELRTPLHGIVNIAESLLEGVAGKPDSDQARQLGMIAATGRRLNFLIHDILDFSTLRNGQLSLNLRSVKLQAAAQSVIEVMEPLLHKKGLYLKQGWPPELPRVNADEDRLRQILFNLIGNAVKFTHRGGVRIYGELLDGMVRISVADTGIGIQKEQMESIFLPYHSGASDGESPRSPGTGIGLGITKKLIELHGGQISVSSTPGEGSVFSFTIPVALNQSEAEEAVKKTSLNQTAVQPHGSGERHPANEPSDDPEHFTVLVVDDDHVNLQVLINLMSMEHYSVIAVDNGEEALEVLSGNSGVDLVITDWMMPEMSGLELCRRIRERFTLSELPVLMLTARNLAGDIGTAFGAGINDFLNKPVDSVVLRARVRTLLELRRSFQSVIRSELAFLQAQIKPHFLYNALNTIISVCPTDPDKATQLLLDLSKYLRSSFDFHSRQQLVSLERELELVQSYSALEQARFGKRLVMEYEVEEGLQLFIPPLSIQPIVENAVRHGVTQKAAGGTVVLKVAQEQDKVIISVRDNGKGIKASERSSLLQDKRHAGGVGLMNIHRRLLSLYGGSGLHIESVEDIGTLVSFEVPWSPVQQDDRVLLSDKERADSGERIRRYPIH
jgi:signal transduction histidine kinase